MWRNRGPHSLNFQPGQRNQVRPWQYLVSSFPFGHYLRSPRFISISYYLWKVQCRAIFGLAAFSKLSQTIWRNICIFRKITAFYGSEVFQFFCESLRICIEENGWKHKTHFIKIKVRLRWKGFNFISTAFDFSNYLLVLFFLTKKYLAELRIKFLQIH